MIEVLRELGDEDVRRLVSGYESTSRYAVTKSESADRTAIVLELADEPFSKRFHTSDSMIGWYRSLLPDGLSFGGFDGQRLVGLAICQRQDWNATCIVWELHVDTEHRRQGIARRLLEHVEDAARGQQLRRVWLETQATNPDAIAFYRACGYEIGGLDLTYYSNDDPATGEVAIFMLKAL